jgi:hypothetical protein
MLLSLDNAFNKEETEDHQGYPDPHKGYGFS